MRGIIIIVSTLCIYCGMEKFKTYLKPKDIERMISTCKYFRDKLIIRILFETGMRVTELLGLKVSDIDYEDNKLAIKWQKRFRKIRQCPKCELLHGRRTYYCRKCGTKLVDTEKEEKKKERFINIDSETINWLKKYIRERKKQTINVFNLDRFEVRDIVKSIANKAGIPKLLNPETGEYHYVGPHKLRDSFAMTRLEKDDTIKGQKKLQLHLGHKSFDTTAKYLKYSEEEMEEWYKQTMS